MSNQRRFLRLAAIVAASLIAKPAIAQSWNNISSARQLWEKDPISVQVEYGAGHLVIEPETGGMLYRMTMRYDQAAASPVTSFDESSRTLRLGLAGRPGRRSMPSNEGARAAISLTKEVPLDLDLEFGAGEADIELGGLRLRQLAISTGASETKISFGAPNPIRASRVSIEAGAAELEVRALGNVRADRMNFQGGVGSTILDFSGDWTADAVAEVEMGIGAVVLRFPRKLGVRIDRSSFLSSFDAPGLVQRDGSYFSSNWSTAEHNLTLELNAALGSVEIEWVD